MRAMWSRACVEGFDRVCVRTDVCDVAHCENVARQNFSGMQDANTMGGERFFVARDFNLEMGSRDVDYDNIGLCGPYSWQRTHGSEDFLSKAMRM